MPRPAPPIVAVDLFCGAGGLSHGLQQAGVIVVAGVDLDSACRFPFESNIDASFLHEDVREITGARLSRLWPKEAIRLLAGCAPCRPFSSHRRGADTSRERDWLLLSEFGRLVAETGVGLVTMENVPRLGSSRVFLDFVADLRAAGYEVSWKSCYGPDYGLAQSRRRLVLLASRLGAIDMPAGPLRGGPHRSVRDEIGNLPPLSAGASDPDDQLHRSRTLSEINLRRIRASRPGGTWKDWPEHLRARATVSQAAPRSATFMPVWSGTARPPRSPPWRTTSAPVGSGTQSRTGRSAFAKPACCKASRGTIASRVKTSQSSSLSWVDS